MLAQVRFFGLTTPQVVAENFFDGDHRGAFRVLEALTARGELHRQQHERGRYYTASPQPLPPGRLEENFAVLWFCRMLSPRRSLVSPKEFRELVRGLADVLGEVVAEPRFRRCVNDDGVLSLLFVQPMHWQAREEPLQHALARLQDLVCSDGFLPWWHLARHELLRLVYLLPDESQTAEFTRWLARHPLRSPLGPTPVPVPVSVYAVPLFPGGAT